MAHKASYTTEKAYLEFFKERGVKNPSSLKQDTVLLPLVLFLQKRKNLDLGPKEGNLLAAQTLNRRYAGMLPKVQTSEGARQTTYRKSTKIYALIFLAGLSLSLAKTEAIEIPNSVK